jgi:hypothetical protein
VIGKIPEYTTILPGIHHAFTSGLCTNLYSHWYPFKYSVCPIEAKQRSAAAFIFLIPTNLLASVVPDITLFSCKKKVPHC